ncbi:MAG: histidine phosphatase family protein [Colwellia sp.]|nr:histidine phosphatase family protein [Colwellia sp.]
MTVISFFLTRHGETQWNKIGKFQGQLDSPLTEKGYQQAHLMAEQLNQKNISCIVSSTLARAEKTAAICQDLLQCPLLLNEQLIERNFGSWQGKLINEVKLDTNYQDIFHQVNNTAPPSGESGIECAERFQQCLIDIVNENKEQPKFIEQTNKHILVVSHGDILRCFLSTLVSNFSNNHAINTQDKAFDNGCIFQINYNIEQQNFTLISVIDITQSLSVALTE